jgi:ribonuclease VapC
MTLDSSALVAIIFGESGYLDLVDRILADDHVRIGAPTLLEATMVASGRRRKGSAATEVEGLVKELGVTVVPFGESEWRLATDAFLRFGRGRHAAALNFGDCLAYATAASVRDSLLFVGEDFRKTDIRPA